MAAALPCHGRETTDHETTDLHCHGALLIQTTAAAAPDKDKNKDKARRKRQQHGRTHARRRPRDFQLRGRPDHSRALRAAIPEPSARPAQESGARRGAAAGWQKNQRSRTPNAVLTAVAGFAARGGYLRRNRQSSTSPSCSDSARRSSDRRLRASDFGGSCDVGRVAVTQLPAEPEPAACGVDTLAGPL